MGKILVITNRKGGCGKSFTTASLGVGLARQGKKVLCIDTDNQHSAAFILLADRLAVKYVYRKHENPLTVVRQFFIMRGEYNHRKENRAELKKTHKSLADTVKLIPDHPHKAHDYSRYTNLAYLITFGKIAKKLREERGADIKAVASDYLSADEMELLKDVDDRICMGIEMGMTYQEMKERLPNVLTFRRAV